MTPTGVFIRAKFLIFLIVFLRGKYVSGIFRGKDPRLVIADLIRTTDSPCSDSSWMYSNATGYCYMFLSGEHALAEARTECKKHNALVLRIEDEEEELFVKQNLVRFTYVDHWLDSKFDDKSQNYSWPNASIITGARWDKGQPVNRTGHCLMFHRTMDGSWTWSSDDCKQKKLIYCRQMARRCPPLYTADHVIATPNKPNIELTIKYSCEPGYVLPNYTKIYQDWTTLMASNNTSNVTLKEPTIKDQPSMEMTCGKDGLWDNTNSSLVVAPCEPEPCSEPPSMEHAEHNITALRTYYPAYVNYTCKHGYLFNDMMRRWRIGYCAADDRRWHQMDGILQLRVKMPQACDPVICGPFKPPANTTTIGRNNKDYDEIRSFRCLEGMMYPDGTVLKSIRCGRNFVHMLAGRWSETELPVCGPLLCPDPYSDNKTRANVTKAQYHYKDALWYQCIDGYEFADSSQNKTIVCTIDAVWKPKINACVEKPVELKITGRRYQPEPVDAPQAEEIGSVALIFVLIMLGVIVLLDLSSLARDLRRMRVNLKHFTRRFTNPVQPSAKVVKSIA